MIQIVSAVFIKLEDDKLKVLLTQRGPATTYPQHWCTPGGKVNKGARLETHQEALARELREELGLKNCPEISEKTLLYRHVGTRTNGEPYALSCYWMHFHGEAVNPNHAEHCIDARWFCADELDGLLLTPADKAHIEQIKALLNGTSEDSADKEDLFQEALIGANALSKRLERILKALNARKPVEREDTVFLGKIAKELETTLKELFQ
jgi:8-oxo-dGTP pyrophosphatase MutT (NUDIX family)